MTDTLTTAELDAIARDAKAALAAGKFYPATIVRLLAVIVPRLCAALKEEWRAFDVFRADNIRLLSEIAELQAQLRDRTNQCLRMRAIIEHESQVTT